MQEKIITFPEPSVMSNLKAKTEYRSVIDCLLVPHDHMISLILHICSLVCCVTF